GNSVGFSDRAGGTPALLCGSCKAPFRFSACIGTMNLWIARQRLGLRQSSGVFGSPPLPKRQKTGALQNLAEVRAMVANALASWSAAVLRRFRCERAPELCAVHGKPSFVGTRDIGTMNRSGTTQGRRLACPANAKARAGIPSALPTGQAGRLPYSAVHAKLPFGFPHALGPRTC